MPPDMPLPRQGSSWWLRGSAIVLLISFVVVPIGVAIMALGIITANIFRGEKVANALFGGGSGGASSVNCANVANVKSEYMEWVKDAAQKWLGGDEAALIAVIQHESTWNPKARNDSGATGLGQFLPGTAKGMKEYVGGDDGKGTFWPKGEVLPGNNPDDARYDPKRAIYATAHYLSLGIQRHGGLVNGYELGYHTHGSDGSQAPNARKARAHVEEIYNKLKNGGGCQSTGGGRTTTGELPAGVAGQIVAIAERFVGTTTKPNPQTGENDFHCANPRKSCASFVSVILEDAGALPPNDFYATTTELWKKSGGTIIINIGDPGDVSKLLPGDVVWFGSGSTATYQGALFNHVGIYIGNGMIIDTSSGKKQVVKRPISDHFGSGGAGALRGAKRFGN